MRDIAIQVHGLGKQYQIGAAQAPYRTLRETIVETFASPFRRLGRVMRHQPAAARAPTIWALRDISFEVGQGEVLGIIGRNGAGKSTLLKILSRITEPTEGYARLHGRVGTLLEVGTGFHPELTGRENIYLNGAILGMRRAEIERKFDEIVAFAEIEQFIDTAVKHYSSGMYLRLAFAVAAHLEPEILIVDEVLAVGDAAFQKKCLGKMSAVASEGRTVLFVSHDMQAISKLTSRCLLLANGSCILNGPTSKVVDAYLEQGMTHDLLYTNQPSPVKPNITRAEVRTSQSGNIQDHGAPIQFTFEIATPVAINRACFSFQIVSTRGQPMLHLWTFDVEREMCRSPGVYRLTCTIPQLRLYMGRYTLSTYLSEGRGGRMFQQLDQICPFEVVMPEQRSEWPWQDGASAYVEDSQWSVEETTNETSSPQAVWA
jgi:lipopolysaccharide transport system ATP-binding protein